MPLMRVKEITGMSSADREKKLAELRVELARIRTMISAGGAVEDPTRVRLLRKTIAQILTVQNEQKLGLRETPKEPEKKEKPKVKPAKKAKKETKEEKAS